MVAAASAPTLLPYIPEGYDVDEEMSIFRGLLHRQFKAANEKVEKLKHKKCEMVKECIAQQKLIEELKQSLGICNATMESFFSKINTTSSTASGEWKKKISENRAMLLFKVLPAKLKSVEDNDLNFIKKGT